MHWIEIYPVDCFNNLLDNRGLGQNVKNPQTQLNLYKQPLFIYSDQAPVFINPFTV